MLILTRKANEKIIIKTKEGDIVIQILNKNDTRRNMNYKFGISAPETVKIWRAELLNRIENNL